MSRQRRVSVWGARERRSQKALIFDPNYSQYKMTLLDITSFGAGAAVAMDQKRYSGSTSIAHVNLASSVFGNGLPMGTSKRLHHATVMRGSL